MESEQQMMQIISQGGDARSSCLKAIEKAQAGEWEEVDELMQNDDASLTKAHQVQTKLIQDEVRGEKVEMSLFMVHAQDHLMNALTVKDLSIALIEEIKMRKNSTK